MRKINNQPTSKIKSTERKIIDEQIKQFSLRDEKKKSSGNNSLKNSQKKRSTSMLLIVVAVFLVLAGMAYYFLFNSSGDNNTVQVGQSYNSDATASNPTASEETEFTKNPELIKIEQDNDFQGSETMPSSGSSLSEELKAIDDFEMVLANRLSYNKFIATEIIQEGGRLTLLAKQYYGASDFWVYIYEANKSTIKNPDNVPVGTKVKIPELDPLLIDADNPRALEKAKELHDLYVEKE